MLTSDLMTGFCSRKNCIGLNGAISFTLNA